MLQWGRGLTSAEIRQQTRGIAASHTCFNGAADLHPRMPRTYIRGNTHRPTSSHRSLSCFNGAADLHPRKYAIRKARAKRANLASMGPRTYIRGNMPTPLDGTKVTCPLQWGRGLTSAEMLVSGGPVSVVGT